MSNNNLSAIRDYLNQSIVGQSEFIEQLLVALLSDGHILVEGPPGLAKTRAVKALSECIEGDFHRVQFTPDLLPADLTGTDIFHPETASFSFQKGPIFHNLVLADEINRAPAKVQSALLEAMAEQQITVGSTSYALPKLFMVMATQNPIEQEGTYPLPEAQLDRFMFKLCLDYPDAENELKILQLTEREAKQVHLRKPEPLTQQKLFALRRAILEVHIAPQLNQYIVDLVVATRQPERYTDEFSQWLEFGASPRASISLARAARAKAWLDGRDFVSPGDIQQLAYPVLRHRLLLSYQAQAKGIQADAVIQRLIELVAFA
ncbi:MoxR family ATPase [Agarivorans sp. TSD2052]|uniref:AAA family ATPase n=1 Tax=Agarivorans sp. TSD2052 TaxID=2937286 RepID=UPI00200D0C75|nr:MoxR family ATPase [Agarivorans sp. TSD2052]UPW20209.1 MoxR family ATPase [Agarivorans sp. TSD2052]